MSHSDWWQRSRLLLAILPILALSGAVAEHIIPRLIHFTYDYYILLRLIIFVTANLFVAVEVRRGRPWWAIVFGSIALLFNPIVQIQLHKGAWFYPDIGAFIAYIVNILPLILENEINLINEESVLLIAELIPFGAAILGYFSLPSTNAQAWSSIGFIMLLASFLILIAREHKSHQTDGWIFVSIILGVSSELFGIAHSIDGTWLLLLSIAALLLYSTMLLPFVATRNMPPGRDDPCPWCLRYRLTSYNDVKETDERVANIRSQREEASWEEL